MRTDTSPATRACGKSRKPSPTCAKRPGDVAARYGGEEFSVILPETDVDRATQLAELMCDAVRALAIPHQGSSLGHVTICVGVASVNPDGLADPQT